MTREEKDRAVDRILQHYRDVGKTIVSDDHSLCRLLSTLEFNRSDREVGEYLCSFLTV